MLGARVAAVEKEVLALRHSNAALRRRVAGRPEDASQSSSAALRRIVDASERTHARSGGAYKFSSASTPPPPPLAPLDAHAWLRSLDLHQLIASQLVSQLGADGDARALERRFLEALGGTTRETVMALVRELPMTELIVDRIIDSCRRRASVAEAEAAAAAMAASASSNARSNHS